MNNINCTGNHLYSSQFNRIPVGIAKFSTGQWDRKLGNHRAVVQVTEPSDAVCAYLPWRRRDAYPQTKHVLVLDANKETVKNSIVTTCNKEYGEIVFQPTTGPGEYHIYYLPPCDDKNAMIWPRDAFPIHRYLPAHSTASNDWLQKHNLCFEDLQTIPLRNPTWPMKGPQTDVYTPTWRKLPEAKLVELQSRGQWHSFYPMETICTLAEQRQIVKQCNYRPFILFPEDRTNPIRMTDEIPYSWAVRDNEQLDNLSCNVQRNEYYVFQIGIYASKDRLENIRVDLADFTSDSGQTISVENITCFNLGGIDQYGQSFQKIVNVDKGKIQALWFGIDIPQNAAPSTYKSTVTISAGQQSQTVNIELNVEDKILEDRGDSDGWRLSRLRWLNSTRAVDDEICQPFTPIELTGNKVNILGRQIELDQTGLLKQVTSFIDMFDITETGRELLQSPAKLQILRNNTPLTFQQQSIESTYQAPGVVKFAATAQNDDLTLITETTIEMEGYIGHDITLTAKTGLNLDNVILQIPLNAGVAKYALGNATSKDTAEDCPAAFQGSLEDCSLLWLGDYNVGLCLELQENNNWTNEGKGIIKHYQQESQRCIELQTGPITVSAQASQTFNVNLSATPYKPLPKEHWSWRYSQPAYHLPADLEKGRAVGAKIFTVHHGKPENPYINYPFDVAPKLKTLADQIHQDGGLFKAYYTLRELSTRAPELWALRSLGYEILPPMPNVPVGRDLCYEELEQQPLEYQLEDPYGTTQTGQDWMCEHLVKDYHTRWHSLIKDGDEICQDSSVQVDGANRWSNFYIEGLDWLMDNAGVDGLYLDGITFDRESFKRVRKTLVRNKSYALIDCHNCPTNVMPQMPFFDSLWYGEGAQYKREPAYWLAAVSGIAFGVPGELLESYGSVQRGMVYGLSQRFDWMPTDQVDPSGLWKWWDSFQIQDAKMLGYWMPNCPITTNNSDIKATAYVHQGKQIAIAVASWAENEVAVELNVDWQAVGLDPECVRITVPEISMFQEHLPNVQLDAVTVQPDKGWIIVISK